MYKRFIGIAAGLLISGAAQAGYLEYPAVQEFISRMSAEHGFERTELVKLFAVAEKKDSIIKAMTRPAEKVKPWKDYRNIFIIEKRIDQGVRFWRENRETLKRAEEKYGVAPEVIVAIIGVETFYGRNKGSYRVIDALSTLSFDYPPRSKFFTGQLEQFLLLAREQGQDPRDLKGSYAGAMGYGQFIPSSYRHYAVDFDGDGVVDIWNNTTDAIGSVANYFARHHWQRGGEVVSRASADEGHDTEFLNQLKLEKTIDELAAMGFSPAKTLPGDMKALPMKLEGERGAEFWLGLPNFYVITRYNHSRLYAMAVHDLSQLILQRVGASAQ